MNFCNQPEVVVNARAAAKQRLPKLAAGARRAAKYPKPKLPSHGNRLSTAPRGCCVESVAQGRRPANRRQSLLPSEEEAGWGGVDIGGGKARVICGAEGVRSHTSTQDVVSAAGTPPRVPGWNRQVFAAVSKALSSALVPLGMSNLTSVTAPTLSTAMSTMVRALNPDGRRSRTNAGRPHVPPMAMGQVMRMKPSSQPASFVLTQRSLVGGLTTGPDANCAWAAAAARANASVRALRRVVETLGMRCLGREVFEDWASRSGQPIRAVAFTVGIELWLQAANALRRPCRPQPMSGLPAPRFSPSPSGPGFGYGHIAAA